MNKRKTVIILIIVAFLVCLTGIGMYVGARRYCNTRSNMISTDGEAHGYYVYPDTPLDSILARVQRDYSIKWKHAFQHDLKQSGLREAKPGYYLFPPEMSDRTLFVRLRQGEQTPVRLRFNQNIRTNEQLASRLSSQLLTDSAAIICLLQDNAFLSKYGMNTETARCLFLPDTYEVYWTMSAEQLFERMHREYQRFWNERRLTEAQALGLTPQEVYTLASIVLSETNAKSEFPIIAGLYLNRKRIGMHLQACPTAVYATRKFNARRVTHEMTHYPSPYNTYINPGLPPGPIRVTPAEVIDSTLHATRSRYLYMCANPDFSGTHVFSESYSQHAAVGRLYHRELNKRKIKK